MGIRAVMAATVAVVALLPSGGQAATEASTICTWGGTPESTTGTLSIKPGLTVTPAEEDLKFFATGELAGGPGCSGEMTFDGVIKAGSTCGWQIFEGKVKGVPGVESFYGPGAATLVYELLYDKDGNVVGMDQPQVLTGTGKGSEATDCNTEEGFTDGNFSSVVEFFG